MNKLAIPAILVATVLVAGIFAFSPVEQASTVHTDIIAQTQSTVVSAGPFTVDDDTDDGTICLDLDAGEGQMTILAAYIVTNDMEGTAQVAVDSIELDGADCDATPSVTINVLDLGPNAIIADVGAAPFETSEFLYTNSGLGELTKITVTDNMIIEIDVTEGTDADTFTYTIDFIVETTGSDTAAIVEDLP